MSEELSQLAYLDLNREFPDTSLALNDPNGLLAVGGDLSEQRLLDAYSRGIFPWYERGQPILWWSPNPRLVLRPEDIHVPKSLHKFMRQRPLTLSINQAFDEVIDHCSKPRDYADGTWITTHMLQAYKTLHRQGHAHSIEVWQEEELVGGLYGIALGSVFFGESMFSRTTNASKVAFTHLAKQLKKWGYSLIDCQVSSAHLKQFGAEEISRQEFESFLPAHKTNSVCLQPDIRWHSEQEDKPL